MKDEKQNPQVSVTDWAGTRGRQGPRMVPRLLTWAMLSPK